MRAINLGPGVENAWVSVVTFLPKLLAFLVILLVGWLVAKAVAKALDLVLERVGFDRWVERGGVGAALARSRYDASGLLARLLYYAVLLITLQVAFGVFGPNPVSALLAGVVAWLPKAAVALVIVVVAAAIATAVKDIVLAALGGLSYGRVLANLAAVFIWGIGIIAALNQVGVAVTVTTPILVTVLATLGGVVVVGVGGGLVRPMQQRWERWLAAAESEAPRARDHVRTQAQARTPAPPPAYGEGQAPGPAGGQHAREDSIDLRQGETTRPLT